MCNATKFSSLALAALLALSACSQADPDKEAASEMLKEIMLDIDAGRHEQALALMDTIDKKYASQIEIRKQVTALRPKAIENVTMKQIATADSILAYSQLDIERLQPLMRHVDGGDLEGYYVASAKNTGFIDRTGIEPRVNDANFTYYIVAQTAGKKLGINQIALNTPSSQMQSEAIPAASERTVAVEGSELATFLPEEVVNLGEWASNNAADIKGGTIYGRNGGHQAVKFTPEQAAAFATAWQFSQAKLRHRQAAILREKLDRRLQVARDQAAQHAPIPDNQ